MSGHSEKRKQEKSPAPHGEAQLAAGGVKLADGSMLAVDGQLAGTPSVLFDAVAVILSDKGAKFLSMKSGAIDV